MQASNQRIDGERLWRLLMEMAEIGATPKGGVRRLALSEVDRQGRVAGSSTHTRRKPGHVEHPTQAGSRAEPPRADHL